MSLWDTFRGLVDKDRQHLIYVGIDPAHVDRKIDPLGMEPDRHYIRLRLAEMFLRKEVAWFKDWYPAVHSLVRFDFANQSVEIPNIADSSRLGMQKSASGAVIAKNFVLTPAMPFSGGIVALNAGLVAIEGENHLNKFLKALGNFASLLSVAQLSSVLNVVQPLALGIQELFDAGNGRMHLGLYNSYSAGELKAGYIAAIRATEDEVDQAKLWVAGDQLRQGTGLNPGEHTPFDGHDYLLLRVEVFENRDDWGKLTSIHEPFQEALRALHDPATEVQAIHHLRTAMLKARQSPELTGADKRRVIESLKEQFEQAKQDLGVRGLVSAATTLKHAIKSAMPVHRALGKGVPTVEEIFAFTQPQPSPGAVPSPPVRMRDADQPLGPRSRYISETIEEAGILMRNAIGTESEPATEAAPEAVPAPEVEAAPTPPRFHFLIEGEAVKGNQVKCGSNADLIFNYDLPPPVILAEIRGHELDALVSSPTADLGITVIPRGFMFRDSIWYKTAKFREGKLEQPVCFKLKAAGQPVEGSGVQVIFDRAGSNLYEFQLPIQIVTSLDSGADSSASGPIDLNLDEIMATGDLMDRTVSLYLSAEGDQLSFLFNDRAMGETFDGKLRRLTRTALADKVGKIRGTLAPVTEHIIWSLIGDRIAAPTVNEQKAFEECLEQVVDAGSSLYAALAADDDFKEVLERINGLEPGSRLSITTDCAFLPWEILYPRRYDTSFTPEVKADNPIQVQELWGYRFAIECLLMGKGAPYKPPLQAHKSAKVFVSYNLNPTIDEKFRESDFKPVAAQENWAKQYDPGTVTVDLKTNGSAIKQVLQTKNYQATLIYLYCHGRNDHPFMDGQTEMLELDRGIEIDPDFLNDGIQFACGPIVFLNSCSSGALSPLSFANFLSRFREKQALGLIATSFPVPAVFAAAFGHEVIQGYIRDRQTPLGEALLQLRRKLLNHNNPLGLFYSLQCPMDVTAPPTK